jgi:sugar/nucleoside kinase (ribokinase family)
MELTSVQVGDDEFGVMLVNVLKDNRVDTKGCVFDANARTALAFVTLRHDGEREFMFYRNPSADMLFEPHELDLALLQEVFSHHLLHSSTTHPCHQCLCIVALLGICRIIMCIGFGYLLCIQDLLRGFAS